MVVKTEPQKRQRSRLNAVFALPKWVTPSQTRRLDRALRKNPSLDVETALMIFAREPATVME